MLYPETLFKNEYTFYKKQRGVALVVAILIVAVVTAISVAIISNNFFTTKRIYRQIGLAQAQSYLYSVEMLAVKLLKQDAKREQVSQEIFDSCNDIWAPVFTQATINEEGIYGGYISDLSARFNLNSLYSANNKTQGLLPRTIEQSRFMSLLMSFNDNEDGYELNSQQVQRITSALVDWIDPDNDKVNVYGAEQGYYQSLGVDAIPNNGPMLDVSELIVVLQVLENPSLAAYVYQRLLPYISIWPLDGSSVINVNTAPPRLLRALNASAAAPLPTTPENFKTVAAQLQIPYRSDNAAQQGIKSAYSSVFSGSQLQTKGLAAHSNYFGLTAYAKLGDVLTRSYSVFERSVDSVTNKVTVKRIAKSDDFIDVQCKP